MRREMLMKNVNWDDLLFRDKMKLIDIWSVVSILANIFQIMGSVYSIFRAS